jgi:hypothetical protein
MDPLCSGQSQTPRGRRDLMRSLVRCGPWSGRKGTETSQGWTPHRNPPRHIVLADVPGQRPGTGKPLSSTWSIRAISPASPAVQSGAVSDLRPPSTGEGESRKDDQPAKERGMWTLKAEKFTTGRIHENSGYTHPQKISGSETASEPRGHGVFTGITDKMAAIDTLEMDHMVTREQRGLLVYLRLFHQPSRSGTGRRTSPTFR